MITFAHLNELLTMPIALAQTELRSGDSLTLATIPVKASQVVTINWLGLHVIRAMPDERTSGVTTATRYTETGITYVSTNRPFFTSSDIGGMIRWTDAGGSSQSGALTTSIILDWVDETTVKVGSDSTIAARQFFTLVQGTPLKESTPLDAVYCGAFTHGFEQTQLPTGHPTNLVGANTPLATIYDPHQRGLYYGPVTLSLAVVNNTTNFTFDVSVTGCCKLHAVDSHS